MTVNGSGALGIVMNHILIQLRLPTTLKDLVHVPTRILTVTRVAGRPRGAYALPFNNTSHRGLNGAKSLSYFGAEKPGSPVNSPPITKSACRSASSGGLFPVGIVNVPLTTTTSNSRPSGRNPIVYP